jgi:hypothetical protein
MVNSFDLLFDIKINKVGSKRDEPHEMFTKIRHKMLCVTFLNGYRKVHSIGFPAFHGTRRFITMFTRAFHWSLS